MHCWLSCSISTGSINTCYTVELLLTVIVYYCWLYLQMQLQIKLYIWYSYLRWNTTAVGYRWSKKHLFLSLWMWLDIRARIWVDCEIIWFWVSIFCCPSIKCWNFIFRSVIDLLLIHIIIITNLHIYSIYCVKLK